MGWVVIIVVSKLNYSIHKIVSLIWYDQLPHTFTHCIARILQHTDPSLSNRTYLWPVSRPSFSAVSKAAGPSSPCRLSPLWSECCCELRAAAVSPLTGSADCSDHATSAGCCSPQHNRWMRSFPMSQFLLKFRQRAGGHPRSTIPYISWDHIRTKI